MAILGVQLVITMIMASMLSKFSGHFSFGRWILCSRLVRYLHPSLEELKRIAGIPTGVAKGKGGKKAAPEPKGAFNTFTVQKNINIQLDCAPITKTDLLPLQYFTEYQWLLDFSVCAVVVYILTELYYAILQPSSEFNLSLMWCLLGIGFCIKVLYSLTVMYFRSQDSAEMSMVFISGFFFLIAAMGVLIIDEDTLEFGLEPGHYNFTLGARKFLEKQGIESAGPASLLTFKIILAVISAFIGAFLTFPGLRLAKMHADALKYASSNPFLQVLLHINIITPLFVALLWLKPIGRDLFTKNHNKKTLFMLDDQTFECLRLMFSMGFCIYRLLIVWPHLQAHLNLAVVKVEEMRKEAGRISAIELQKLVTRVYFYLCVVALQYVAPLLLLLFSLMMLKTLGNYSFGPVVGIHFPVRVVHNTTAGSIPYYSRVDDITGTVAQFSLAIASLREVFTSLYFQGIFSFFCWWICAVWFTTSAFGMIYHGYFTG